MAFYNTFCNSTAEITILCILLNISFVLNERPKKSYKFGLTWGWRHDDKILILGWTFLKSLWIIPINTACSCGRSMRMGTDTSSRSLSDNVVSFAPPLEPPIWRLAPFLLSLIHISRLRPTAPVGEMSELVWRKDPGMGPTIPIPDSHCTAEL